MALSCRAVGVETDRVDLEVNGSDISVEVVPGESLLSVLRERLGLISVKDGCAPQGQCGCCTVLVDGKPRVACVTPAARVAGRSITTAEGLEPDQADHWGVAFCATGGSQCGFCTPGIVMRLVGRGPAPLDRALAAHLCRCTGWQTIVEAGEWEGDPSDAVADRDLDAGSRRAELEGGVPQRVSPEVPLGAGGFADDTAPRDALVAVPDAAGGWSVGESLLEARERAGKVQGRNAPADLPPPIPLPDRPEGGVRLATGWVEPAYLEPDASWCEPGGEPATPLANGGAFGGKASSIAPDVARRLADEHGRTVRVVLSREDVVRMGPKRPPVSASAIFDGSTVRIDGRVVAPGEAFGRHFAWLYDLNIEVAAEAVEMPGPPVSDEIRGSGWAEQVVLLEGALQEAGADRSALTDEAGHAVLLDNSVLAPPGARAGARVETDDAGRVTRVHVKVAAGDPLDEVVLRSYVIGGAHMGLGWVLSEGVAVDPETGEVLDLTIRSFGVIRAQDTPPIEVEIVDPTGPPVGGAGDAAFAAVAAATWNALARATGQRPESFPVGR